MRRTYLPGQTLVEMLIVLFIISIGLYGAVTLIFANVAVQQQDADQTVAMNLAREALELAQNQRDSNWLAGNLAFDDGMLVDGATPKTDCEGISNWEGGGVPGPAFDFAPDTLAQARIYRNAKPSIQDYYTNVTQATTTDYYRLWTFTPICQDPSNVNNKAAADGSCSCPPATQPTWNVKVGMRVKADVGWKRGTSNKQLTLYADYYDWR